MTKNFQKLEKNCKFYQKIAKICNVEMLKIILLPLKIMQLPIIKLTKRFIDSKGQKTSKMIKFFKKLEKNCIY